MATFNMTAMRASLVGCSRPAVRTAAPKTVLLPAFSGLSAAHRLSAGSPDTSPQNFFNLPTNGAKVFAMRHQKRIAKLGRPADQRKALVRGLVTEVLRHGKITTTKTKAKAIRKYVDKMIQLAKDGSLHARRQALGFVYDKNLVKTLFTEAPTRYGTRNGGYCRVVNEIRLRRGDAAQMAVIELV